jgi:hypothetical protein
MNYLVHTFFLGLLLVGCRDTKSSRSTALPDNVMEDRPIILKEGQGVVLVPEGNKSLLVGVSVVDGKLSVSEIDPEGRSFSVTWDDPEIWETSTMNSAEDKTTTLVDKDGDGMPDLRAVMTKGSLSRFTLEPPKWVEIESKTKSEQDSAPNPLPAE